MSIPDFADTSRWAPHANVNVFREHEIKDRAGKIVRAVDKAKLDTICRNLNVKDSQGQLCAITIGHTIDDEHDDQGKLIFKAKETDQPQIAGYAREFKVCYDGALKAFVIRAGKWYIDRAKEAEAKSYPRVSPEWWPKGDLLEPISIIRRTPRLDLGQWCYTRNGQRIRYAMGEWDMPDPVAAPDAAEADGQLEEKIMRCVMRCLKDPEVLKMMATPAAPAAPGPLNAAAPAAPAPESERFANEAEKIRYTRQQGEIDRLKAEAAEIKLTYSRAGAESTVKQLLYEGFDVGGADEKQRAERTERMVQKFMRLEPKERGEYEAEIRECYQRAPVGGPMLRTYEPQAGRQESDEPSEQETMAAVQYMRKSGKDWDEAIKFVRKKTG